MNKLLKINWIIFCVIIFCISRLLIIYEYNVVNEITNMHNTFSQLMCKWDCEWYLTIINGGYDTHIRSSPPIWKNQANWAFFPLFPFIVKAVSVLIRVNPTTSGIFLNQLLLLGSMFIFYKYLKIFMTEINSRFGVILLAFSPFNIYFASLYTESLFLFLSLSSFYLMRKEKYLFAAVVGAGMSATRMTGIILIFSFVINYLRKYKLNYKIVIYIIIILSGLISYMMYLHFKINDWLAFITISKSGWGRDGFHIQYLGSQILWMVSNTHDSVFFIISIILSIFLIKEKYIEEGVFNLLAALPGVFSGMMYSEARYVGGLFTFYFALVLMSPKSITYKSGTLLIFLILDISYFLYWMLGWFNFLI